MPGGEKIQLFLLYRAKKSVDLNWYAEKGHGGEAALQASLAPLGEEMGKIKDVHLKGWTSFILERETRLELATR